MRFVLPLTVLTVGLMISFAGAAVQPPLLVAIIFLLLYQLFRKRDFYVVEHFLYDLNFVQSPGFQGRPGMTVDRGPMLGDGACRSVGFSDYAAAKAFFDFQEDSYSGEHMKGYEAIHRVYVVSAWRKPANAWLKDDEFRDRLLHRTPYEIMFARRREAKEDRLLMIGITRWSDPPVA
jgi:hypothetical protein